MQKGIILIADDSEINRYMLREMFENSYEIIEADNGDDTLSIINEYGRKISVVLLDIVMPKTSGLDVLKEMHRTGIIRHVPVILVTANYTEDIEDQAYLLGASDVVSKPYSRRVVLKRTNNIVELYKEKNNMAKELKKRSEALIESHEKLQKQNDFLVNALSSVVEYRDLESGEHVQRVKNYTKIMLTYLLIYHPEYGLTEEDAEIITLTSALHDLGKIAIPDRILTKPGTLTHDEFEEIKKHTIYGCEILNHFKQEETPFYKTCYEICRSHHERYDGSGYPDGLKGDEIPISAQIVSIVDVFDALSSKRVYKDAYPLETAYTMIVSGECGSFSPAILDCFKRAKDAIFECTKLLNNKAV